MMILRFYAAKGFLYKSFIAIDRTFIYTERLQRSANDKNAVTWGRVQRT